MAKRRTERKVSVDIISKFDWSFLNPSDVEMLQTYTRNLSRSYGLSDDALIRTTERLARRHIKALHELAVSDAPGDAELLWNFDWSLAHHLIFRNVAEQRGLWGELDKMDARIERDCGAFWSVI